MKYLRHIRTTQERRANIDRKWNRPKRGPRMIPNSWDDIPKSCYDDRSWKRNRKTQYKVKGNKKKKDSSSYGRSMSKRNHFHLEHYWCMFERRRCAYCRNNHVWG